MSLPIEVPVSQKALGVISRLDRFRTDWATSPGISDERLRRLEEAARIQSIGASCRLSGIRVSDHEVAGALRGNSVPIADVRSILGYAAGLELPRSEHGALLSREHLCELNAVVLGRPAGRATSESPSPWRREASHCEAFDAQGRATGRIIPILPPRLIEQKLDELLTWYELESRSSERHPVPTIAAFVLGMMAISPFERGNGRTIRLLTRRLLDRAGYAFVPYASLEAQMEDLREVYYDAFDRAQMGIWSGGSDIEPWIEYFAEVLDRFRARLDAKVSLERGSPELSPLQQSILDTVREHGTVDAGLLIDATGANRNTLKDNLRRMVERGLLERSGQRRTARYRLASAHPVRS